jgi:soluble lytic murein transglycosylase-like protein
MTWRDGSLARQWIPVISATEAHYEIPSGLSARQCYQESRFNPDAHNTASGAIGLFQLLPQYFPGAGQSPIRDVDTAGKYLASLAKQFKGDWQLGLAAYDFGPGNIDKWLKSKGTFDTLPLETRN